MRVFDTSFCRTLGIDFPIIQGPMNGASPPALAAAASNAGGLGSCAAATLTPDGITAMIRTVRTMTSKPFNVNLFVLSKLTPDATVVERARERLAPFYAALNCEQPPAPSLFAEDFQAQRETLLQAAPPIVSFTFGVLPRDQVTQFQRAGSRVIGTATTVAEARAWHDAGADFICAQGAEAGGHRATFIGDMEQACIGTIALVPQIAAAVPIPVIAAGGLMDGRAIAATLMLGAQGAQLGTAFLSCPECSIAPVWKAALLAATDDSTRLTRTFSGRHARGLVNQFMQQMQPFEAELPPYPIQNALTAPLRQAASQVGRAEFLSLWAGQGAAMSRTLPAAQLMALLADEMQRATDKWASA